MKNILITGPVRSGKSSFALSLVPHDAQAVVFVATCLPQDNEMRARVTCHQAQRPAHWQTVEVPVELPAFLSQARPSQTIVVDCITLWLSNLLIAEMSDEQVREKSEQLCEVLQSKKSRVIFVTNEVGWGIVPQNGLARRFRDLAGTVHQRLSQVCDEVFLVVAGIPLQLKGNTK